MGHVRAVETTSGTGARLCTAAGGKAGSAVRAGLAEVSRDEGTKGNAEQPNTSPQSAGSFRSGGSVAGRRQLGALGDRALPGQSRITRIGVAANLEAKIEKRLRSEAAASGFPSAGGR